MKRGTRLLRRKKLVVRFVPLPPVALIPVMLTKKLGLKAKDFDPKANAKHLRPKAKAKDLRCQGQIFHGFLNRLFKCSRFVCVSMFAYYFLF